MKQLVVLGSSLAGLTAIERIKERSQDFGFTLISLDGTHPAYRNRFAQAINREIKQDALWVKEKSWYEKNGVSVLLDKKISRINFNRKYLFTEEKEQIDYDILLLCDFPADQWPQIKGTGKNGVFSLNKAKNVVDFCTTMPIIESVVIESDRVDGFCVALAYSEQGKDVSLITRKEWLLPSFFSREVSDALINALAEKGLNVYTNNEIGEILGEGDAKAVRLKTNKVLASDVTILADVLPDPKFLKGTSIALAERVVVDKSGSTNIGGVYAVDLASQKPGIHHGLFKNAETLIQEGAAVAASVLGEELLLENRFFPREFNGSSFNVSFYGNSFLGSDSKSIFDPQSLVYKRIVYHQGKPSGVILINAAEKKEFFEQYLSGKCDFDHIESDFMIEPKIGSGVKPEHCATEGEAVDAQNIVDQELKDSQSV